MLELTKKQTEYLTMKRDAAVDKVDQLFNKLLAARRAGLGNLSISLGWRTEDLMLQDSLAAFYNGVLSLTQLRAHSTHTLARLIKAHTERCWQHEALNSTSPGSNLAAEQANRARQRLVVALQETLEVE